ncbi:MAG: hypothetical protein ACRENP_22305 [Longimicrobiales bacterium]
MSNIRGSLTVVGLLILAACNPVTDPEEVPAGPDTALIALTDMGTRTYLSSNGGLYPDRSNVLPAAHAQRGVAQARLIEPLDVTGRPSAAGKYVLLSIGMSNTTQEFCAQAGTNCDPGTFAGLAAADPSVNRSTLAIVNGARGGQVAEAWDSPGEDNYRRIRDEILTPAGLSEAQVQIVWLKVARSNPRLSLPDAGADAYVLHQLMGSIARALKVRYPNLRQIFASSRTYAGFATTALNPEPYAYESGFAVKWLIESQIRQLDTGTTDARAGNLALAVAPWIAWGAYLWAGDAAHARSDGFFYVQQDFAQDGTHPSQSGRRKVGQLLLDFFKTSPHTSCWFLAGRTCT